MLLICPTGLDADFGTGQRERPYIYIYIYICFFVRECLVRLLRFDPSISLLVYFTPLLHASAATLSHTPLPPHTSTSQPDITQEHKNISTPSHRITINTLQTKKIQIYKIFSKNYRIKKQFQEITHQLKQTQKHNQKSFHEHKYINEMILNTLQHMANNHQLTTTQHSQKKQWLTPTHNITM